MNDRRVCILITSPETGSTGNTNRNLYDQTQRQRQTQRQEEKEKDTETWQVKALSTEKSEKRITQGRRLASLVDVH